MTNNPQTKNLISHVEGVISLAGAGNAVRKPVETLKSVPQTISAAIDLYSSYKYAPKLKQAFSPNPQLKPQPR